jgi:hypothetical protein
VHQNLPLNMYTEFTYDVYIPSLGTSIKVKPVLVEQFKTLVEKSYSIPFLNIGFNLELNNILKQNVDVYDKINEIDKAIIALHIRQNDLDLKTNIPTNLKVPKDLLIQDIICKVPTLVQEDEHLQYVITLLQIGNPPTDSLLLAEISKYIFKDIPFTDKISLVSSLPIDTLASIVKYIDSIKNTLNLPYSVSLFLE